MEIATAQPQPQTSYDEWRDRHWRLTALTLALLWLAMVPALVLTGEKRSDLGMLEAGLADGSVTRVEVVGLPPSPEWHGRTQVTLQWRGSVPARFADVTVDTRRNLATSGQGDRINGDLEAHLRGFGTQPTLTYSESRSGPFIEWRDWRGPGWTALLGAMALCGTILLAGAGPQPWRATHWAWIWLILLGGPLGALAFLLVGGPLGRWRPRDPDKRLTGGWAFLIALALFGGGNAL